MCGIFEAYTTITAIRLNILNPPIYAR